GQLECSRASCAKSAPPAMAAFSSLHFSSVDTRMWRAEACAMRIISIQIVRGNSLKGGMVTQLAFRRASALQECMLVAVLPSELVGKYRESRNACPRQGLARRYHWFVGR